MLAAWFHAICPLQLVCGTEPLGVPPWPAPDPADTRRSNSVGGTPFELPGNDSTVTRWRLSVSNAGSARGRQDNLHFEAHEVFAKRTQ